MNSKFELDEDIEEFLSIFGSPCDSKSCEVVTIKKYKDKLPDRLLEYWQEYGFCGFRDGLLWIVNPDDYEDTLDEWLEHTDIPDKDVYYVFARSAFGELYLWGENTGFKYKIVAANGWVVEQEGNSREENDFSIQFFFGMSDIDEYDEKDENGEFLFDACVKKHGPLAYDEMFGFTPSLIVGGTQELAHVEKVNIYIHLSILAQFGQIEVLDQKGLISKAFG